MARAHCQQALDRVITYLRTCGIQPSHAVCRRALQLVDDVFGEWESAGGDGAEPAITWLMERAMDRLPTYFDLPEAKVPLQSPPLQRGSIGYSDHV
jgi:hypothetical protein